MCGIVGIVFETGEPHEGDIAAMLQALRHRGPDDQGQWVSADRRVRLGHQRLAIIDLSEAGRQPLSNEDGTVWITYNGEIYNFQSLRQELEALGHQFRSRTDTEVIVHAYEQWGTECVKRLRGMFAFGVWDEKRRRLFLARDRVGKKPLFYARVGGRFLFASELQGLLADPAVPRQVDPQALDAYLSLGYVPAPQTAFRDIQKLPPAHWLTLELSSTGPTVRIEQYWHLEYLPKLNLTEEEAIEALREKLTEAVRLRLISDVPVGAFLSGGIDSSIIVGVMASLLDQPVKTFSIGFEEAAYNELDHARRIAERWQTDHHEFIVQPDALEILPLLVRHYGEPFADSSAIPTFYVCKLTRSSVTVALNGDGGDENFAGYERYFANQAAEWMQAVPGSAMVGRAVNRILPAGLAPKHRLRYLKRFLSAATQPMARRYGSWVGYFDQQMKAHLYSAAFQASLNGRHGADEWLEGLFEQARHLTPVEAAMSVDVRSYLPYDLLVKVDITAMANGLEARSPFLDHEVMELVARLPAELKWRGRESKYLLKRAFRQMLPPENVNRRKMGFGVPVGAWFRGALRPMLEEALLSEQSRRRGYFRPEAVHRMVSEHLEQRADHSFLLWNLLMLELWHREFIK
ncbi:MAG: asparagine synthase (glutamine-hydrolyzing) [Blastocatellia bacterium]|nr:asparagine synthase (glutamine-hydrolyzing) [Blastocatellia bacterium]